MPNLTRRKLLAAIGATGAAAVLFKASAGATTGMDPSVLEAVYSEGKLKPKLTRTDLCISTSISELRAESDPVEGFAYFVTDVGMEGFFQYDPGDTSSPDNTGTILVSTSGARFKRIIE